MAFEIIGYFFIFLGLIFVLVGTLGLYKFKNFYTRILLSSQIDTIGFILIMLGVIFLKGFNFFTLKVILIIAITLIISPLNTHAISRSAYKSGYHREKGDTDAS